MVNQAALEIASELSQFQERLEEIRDWALDVDNRPVADKIEEALGPLASAELAARQYAVGFFDED